MAVDDLYPVYVAAIKQEERTRQQTQSPFLLW